MRRIIGSLLLVFALCTPSWAAIDCDSSTLTSAISAASTGATITCNAGDWTWANAIAISKEIKLIGAGIGNTNITCSSYICISTDEGSADNVRVSGFTFSYAATGAYMLVMNGEGWRVDNNRFVGADGDGEAVVARSNVSGVHSYGVINSNQMVNVGVLVEGSYAMLAENTQQHVLWAQSPDLGGGTSGVVYIEGNTYTKNGTSAGATNWIDANYGGRYVARYNTITTGDTCGNALYAEAHSVQGVNRAVQRWEIYNNIVDNQASAVYEPFRLRGGTGIVFNNSILGNWSNYEIALDNVRSQTGQGPFTQGHCDGEATDNWDQNTSGQTGYACRDQIGYGQDTVQWAPGNAWSQVKMPIYAWNNKKVDGTTELLFAVVINNIGNHIQANRDYYDYTASFDGTTGVGRGVIASRPATCATGVGYFATNQGTLGTLFKCTVTDTWTSYFTPYTCPHPLTGLTGGCNAVTAGTAGYNTEVEDPTDTTAPAISAFTVPSSNVGYVVPVTLTCTDAVGVTGWCLVETDSYAGCSWAGAVITSKTFSTQGAKTLYAFCRDGSGNISTSSTDSVTVTSGRGATALLGTGSVVRIGTGSEFTIGTSSGTQGP
jgi:hypothetical protein